MDGPTLQGLIAKGYQRGAAHIGSAHNWYRGPYLNPMTAPYLLGSLPAAFAVDAQFKSLGKQQTIWWRAFVDTTQVQLGDILAGPETWVIVDGGLRPPTALVCPQTISISRAVQQFSQSAGASQTLTPIVTDYPCNIQLKRDKGFSEPLGFAAPSNTSAPMPMWMIYLPILKDGLILPADMLIDDDGNTYKVDAVNYGIYGYEIAATPYEPPA